MWKLLFVLYCMLTLSGCEKPPVTAGTSGSTPARQKVTIALVNQPQSTLIFVAMKKGYFSDEGLDVQPLQSFGKAALQTMIEGKADFATSAETPIMFSILRGDAIFVVANIETSTANDAVVARVDAGISKPADLKGKRIGFMPGTTIDFFLDSFLTAQGLTRQDITPVPLKPDEMLDALLAKKADAVAAWNYPLTQIKRQLGAQAVTFYDRQIYTEHFNIAAMQDFVRAKPADCRRFVARPGSGRGVCVKQCRRGARHRGRDHQGGKGPGRGGVECDELPGPSRPEPDDYAGG